MWVVKITYLDPDKDEKEKKTVYIGSGVLSGGMAVSHKGEAVVFTKSVTEPFESGYIRAFLHNNRIDDEAVETLEIVKL